MSYIYVQMLKNAYNFTCLGYFYASSYLLRKKIPMKNHQQIIEILENVDRNYQKDCQKKSTDYFGRKRYKTFSENFRKFKDNPGNIDSLIKIFELCDDIRTSRLRNRILDASCDILEIKLPVKQKLTITDPIATARFAERQYPIATTIFSRLRCPETYEIPSSRSDDRYSEESYILEKMIRHSVKQLKVSLTDKNVSVCKIR